MHGPLGGVTAVCRGGPCIIHSRSELACNGGLVDSTCCCLGWASSSGGGGGASLGGDGVRCLGSVATMSLSHWSPPEGFLSSASIHASSSSSSDNSLGVVFFEPVPFPATIVDVVTACARCSRSLSRTLSKARSSSNFVKSFRKYAGQFLTTCRAFFAVAVLIASSALCTLSRPPCPRKACRCCRMR